jgi:microsomal dipeptidase-like Zn-dependent dipeptidase
MTSDPPFVVDLHAHLPMQWDPNQSFRRHIRRAVHRHEKLVDKLEFVAMDVANRLLNWRSAFAGPAVTIETLAAGNVGVALSVAYWPFFEMDVDKPYASPPSDAYFETLYRLLTDVEGHVKDDPRATMVASPAELEAALGAGKIAIIHAIEGGFHVGGTAPGVVKHTVRLAELGVGYVTVAHLFWRRVATNVAAIPFLPDAMYRDIFTQPDTGLDELGRVMIREMVRHGILIDITHMSQQSMRDTFALLDEIDPGKTIPVIATHIACSFGKYAYNLTQEWVERVAERKGVCGIIYCDHFMRDGRFCKTRNFEQSFRVVASQVDRLRSWAGDDVLAIGSDLDGFIKPTLAGLSSAANHRDLAARLESAYGRPLAQRICHENALRVLKQAWMKPLG